MPARGHRKRPGDDQLVAAFLAATADLSVHEVERETENAGTGRVSHGTIARLRRGAWTGLTAATRRSLKQYLERIPPAADGQGAELRLVARYLERLAQALREQANGREKHPLAVGEVLRLELGDPAARANRDASRSAEREQSGS